MELFPPYSTAPWAAHQVTGRLRVAAPGQMFIEPGGLALPLDNLAKRLNRALPGDQVVYDTKDQQVVAVTQRVKARWVVAINLSSTRIMGKTKTGALVYHARSTDWRYPDCYVSSKLKQQLQRARGKAHQSETGLPDHYLYVEFREWSSIQRMPMASQIEVLGPVGLLESEERVLIRRNQLYARAFPKLELPNPNLPQLGSGEDTRVLYDKMVLAIDPKSAQDYDDAFHVERTEGGEVKRIVVHIADVTYYFPLKSELETEIRKRLTTLYLISHKINMIPDQFADDLSSLKARQTRPTISVVFHYDTHGRELVDRRQFQLSLTQVSYNMAYELADRVVWGEREHPARQDLQDLAKLLQVQDSHQIVERLMIKANHAVGEWLYQRGWGLIRTQDRYVAPTQEVPAEVAEFVRHRAGKAARYQFNPAKDQTGHASLGLSCYTHFSSPIRRYPDMIVHRLLKSELSGQPSGYTRAELTELCQQLNTYYTRVRKMTYQLNILRLYHRLNQEFKGQYQTRAYPVDFQAGKLSVYLPEFDLEYAYRLRSDQECPELFRECMVWLTTNTVTPYLSQRVKLSL